MSVAREDRKSRLRHLTSESEGKRTSQLRARTSEFAPHPDMLGVVLDRIGVVNGTDFRVMNDLVASNPAGLYSNAEIKRRG